VSIIALIADGKLKHHLERAYYALSGFPMHMAVGIDMAAQYVHSKGDVRSHHQGNVAEPPNH
jgi:hypothetical protein